MPKPNTRASNAFIDYYNAQGIIPVRQDLSDTENFIFRRNYLYKTLGLSLRQLKGRSIIEFGPGGGYNAIATSHYNPENYVFVDATKASLTELHKKWEEKKFGATNVEIIESNIFDYRDERTYDLVICEGVLPAQNEPKRMLTHVASFCNEGGIIFITTMSASSQLSEICRRVLRPSIMTPGSSFQQQTETAVGFFKSHLDTLGVSTRPPEDWVQDQILHDWHTGEYVFTALDAMEALGDGFEFYSSSPRFLTDGRWYKQINRSNASTNSLLAEQFAAFNALLLDYRVPFHHLNQHTNTDKMARVEPLCKAACMIHNQILEENSYNRLDDFIAALTELSDALADEFAPTVRSIHDYIAGIRAVASGNSNADFGSFKQWWGRGQQYISYIKA